jgi:hypothetical protein
MRKIILPGKVRRDDIARARRTEKETVEARDRCILEFPLSMSPNAVAKALREEGWTASERPSITSSIASGGCGKRRSERVLDKVKDYRDITR